MPVNYRINDNNERVLGYWYGMLGTGVSHTNSEGIKEYEHPETVHIILLPTGDADDYLRTERRKATQYIDELNGLKKACEKDKNYDAARWYREEISRFQKRYRAICFIGGWYMDNPRPGDCQKQVPVQHWPVELAEDLDLILMNISLL